MDESKNQGKIPDFSSAERSKVPREFTWKTEDVYPGFDDWQRDKTLVLEMIQQIKDLTREWTASAQRVCRLLNHLDEIDKKMSRLHVYASLFADTDMTNPSYQSIKGELQVLDVNLHSMLSFIRPDILRLGREKIDLYLETEPGLKVYELFFDKILRLTDHILEADKEEIAALTGLFSGAAEKAAKLLNDVEIPYPRITLSDGKTFRLSPANYQRYKEAKNRADRSKVMRTYWKHHTRFKNTQAALLDGEIQSHFFNARVHRFQNCLEAALFPKNIDVQVYHTLVATVKENLSPLHRYLKLKSRLLKLDRMTYDDIYASSVPALEKNFTIAEARSLVLKALQPMPPEYSAALSKGLEDRWMDVYPNKGKCSGAYANGSIYEVHPYVLMNYNGTFNTVFTLAHEFGHAMHSYFSNKTQPFALAHYPIFLAEIASTFNEALLVHYLARTQDDDLFKLFVLDRYFEELRGTLYRQTLFAEFELSMHQEVEKGKTLTHEWLDEKYLSLTRQYYGHPEVMEVDKYIANEWSSVPHFYYNFYVYQYSTGIVAATALADMVLKGGKTERARYLEFLKAGGSDYPLNILKKAGVDLTSPAPLLAAFKKIDELLDQMEKIASLTPDSSGSPASRPSSCLS